MEASHACFVTAARTASLSNLRSPAALRSSFAQFFSVGICLPLTGVILTWSWQVAALRLKTKGSHGGQNGMRSIITCLGGNQARLRSDAAASAAHEKARRLVLPLTIQPPLLRPTPSRSFQDSESASGDLLAPSRCPTTC